MEKIKVNYVRSGGLKGKGFLVGTEAEPSHFGATREFISTFPVSYGDILNIELKDGIAHVVSRYKPAAHDMHTKD
ncbi:hypothetical protein HYS48_02425 [Candidatus Woesearchaeota archaeon]|nr:hypothetical protein [Candidatus Woesearchaeota archaeon]